MVFIALRWFFFSYENEFPISLSWKSVEPNEVKIEETLFTVLFFDESRQEITGYLGYWALLKWHAFRFQGPLCLMLCLEKQVCKKKKQQKEIGTSWRPGTIELKKSILRVLWCIVLFYLFLPDLFSFVFVNSKVDECHCFWHFRDQTVCHEDFLFWNWKRIIN